ncbi:hypothetical protein EVAR_57734_1 [Eumeta japonica]|uniref:Uncharacterized protein n=1 Tax=Eumeta variegata TaxID=151549 RepID=A0A4C1Y798_EUMVA|nr:hypothetical protein EVAR_57734_1 [Eumeta japonica]
MANRLRLRRAMGILQKYSSTTPFPKFVNDGPPSHTRARPPSSLAENLRPTEHARRMSELTLTRALQE